MRLHYYPGTDSLYIENCRPVRASRRPIADGLNVDLDGAGHAVGIDIDGASSRIDLTSRDFIRHNG